MDDAEPLHTSCIIVVLHSCASVPPPQTGSHRIFAEKFTGKKIPQSQFTSQQKKREEHQ